MGGRGRFKELSLWVKAEVQNQTIDGGTFSAAAKSLGVSLSQSIFEHGAGDWKQHVSTTTLHWRHVVADRRENNSRAFVGFGEVAAICF